MKRTGYRFCVMAACAAALSAGGAFGQATEQGMVTGSGTVTMTRTPETMRVQIALLGKGPTPKEALAALRTRTESARTQLVALGADKESLHVDPAKVAKDQNDQQRRMEMMMRSRIAGGGKASKKKVTPPVLVSATIAAEWKLTAKTPEELLLAVHPLQEKIRAADLAGSKEAEKLTPEEEELAEEAEAATSYRSYNGEEQKPGEPTFVFVSRVSEAEREKALADAFQKAKAQAAKLAKAAGTELGALRSITGADASGADASEYYGGYNASMMRALQMARARQGGDQDTESQEAIGAEPGPVKYNVTVNASFDLRVGK